MNTNINYPTAKPKIQCDGCDDPTHKEQDKSQVVMPAADVETQDIKADYDVTYTISTTRISPVWRIS